ncbi:MAG: GNAT family N-acetyltransferase [Acidimicrobiia bacterium]|nr:GNAT family N-acetyltransferase [Acidimicrobiia bacterium]
MFELTTARLTLRPLQASDVHAFVAYRRDPMVARYQGWDPSYSAADAEQLVTTQPEAPGRPDEWLQLAIIDRADGALCGDCAVRVVSGQPRTAEIGVTLTREHQGRGIATEALGAVLGRLFGEVALHRVFAEADDRNTAVHRVLERLGFRLEARLVDADWHKDEWTTLRIYALLAEEWLSVDDRSARLPR